MRQKYQELRHKNEQAKSKLSSQNETIQHLERYQKKHICEIDSLKKLCRGLGSDVDSDFSVDSTAFTPRSSQSEVEKLQQKMRIMQESHDEQVAALKTRLYATAEESEARFIYSPDLANARRTLERLRAAKIAAEQDHDEQIEVLQSKLDEVTEYSEYRISCQVELMQKMSRLQDEYKSFMAQTIEREEEANSRDEKRRGAIQFLMGRIDDPLASSSSPKKRAKNFVEATKDKLQRLAGNVDSEWERLAAIELLRERSEQLNEEQRLVFKRLEELNLEY